MMEINKAWIELLDRKTLEAVEELPAEELKHKIIEILRNGETLSTLPVALGVQQPLERVIQEFCKSQ